MVGPKATQELRLLSVLFALFNAHFVVTAYLTNTFDEMLRHTNQERLVFRISVLENKLASIKVKKE